MPDIVSPEVRSRMMAGIRSKNTNPEMIMRRGLHGVGFRFRLHAKELPGKPDLVFPRWNAVIFVNGCFWHGHHCNLFRWPSTRETFWRNKIDRNRAVDGRTIAALSDLGWRYAIVWECALKGRNRLPAGKVVGFCAAWLKSDLAMIEIRGLV